MPKNRHPELEGYEHAPLYTFELKSRRKTLLRRFSWAMVGATLGSSLTLAALQGIPWLAPRLGQLVQVWQSPPEVPPAIAAPDPWQEGLNQAMNAAALTQTATGLAQWSEVSILWQQAINRLRSLAPTHPRYALAQQKITEYQRNLDYAQGRLQALQQASQQPPRHWTLGSDLDLVLAIQDMPARVVRYDQSCKEVLHYGSSQVELKNGYVSDYTDTAGNLRVLAAPPVALSVRGQAETWSLGASQAEVIQIQGAPTRRLTYDHSVTLYYGNSSVWLDRNQVIGYANHDNNLKVAVIPHARDPDASQAQTWSLGSRRIQVLQAQPQAPTAIHRRDRNCEEILYFENSAVVLRQGIVSEYQNTSQNLTLVQP